MSEMDLQAIRDLLQRCSAEERRVIFQELRKDHTIHEFEKILGASAETILEAFHRSPELTVRMMRGVIADAAFGTQVVPKLADRQWRDITPEGNFLYDYKLDDGCGPITVQVKLQRSLKGRPHFDWGGRYDMGKAVYIVETQKTRTGNDGEVETRPYRYGDFDVLAVAMQPSAKQWDRFKFTLSRWLIPKTMGSNEIATLQPVAIEPSDYWTDDFVEVAAWFRAADDGRRMTKTNKRRPRGWTPPDNLGQAELEPPS